jgi:hypothetical protein
MKILKKNKTTNEELLKIKEQTGLIKTKRITTTKDLD